MFERRLGAMADRAGCRLAALVAADGIPVEVSAGSGAAPDLHTETLAVELLTQLKAMSQNHGDLELGEVSGLALETVTFSILLSGVAPGYYLLLVLDAGAGTGRARYELRRAPLDFESDLV